MNFDVFYLDRGGFERYSNEHIFVLISCLIFGIVFIYMGVRKWDDVKRRKYAIILASVMIFLQLVKLMIRLTIGNFDHRTDLPFHLCNMMPFFLFFIFKYGKKEWWAIFSFWIMAGTFQALFTPSLTDHLPHYEAFRYWIVHAGAVILVLYGLIVYRWQLEFKYVFYSAIAMNAMALLVYPFNCFMGSNYYYLNGKPAGTTLYSILPEWPTYIMCLEGLVLVLFTVVYFLFKGLTLMTKSVA